MWDFKIPRVVSINTSGHKFGLSYVGVGWVIWRSPKFLPKDLIFELHYLGSVEYSFSLNFSRPAAPIIAQYFNFLHLGFQGYRRVALADLENARTLSRALERSTYFTVLSDIHRFVDSDTSSITGAAKQAIKSANEEDVEVCSHISHLGICHSSQPSRIMFRACQWWLSVSQMNSNGNIQRFSRGGSRLCYARKDGGSCNTRCSLI